MQSQFSLSVELTRLVPLALEVAGKTYEAAMSLARDLQNAGSDIVVEEDLAQMFGRSLIQHGIASSFRSVMSQSNGLEPWHDGIGLFHGAGPTVNRALTEPHYLSTVIQLSFLVSTHERNSLAAAITRYCEKVAEDAPYDKPPDRAPPNMGSVRGMLQACEDQTEKFSWRQQLLAVATSLGLEEEAIYETIPQTILHGLIPMLPIAQKLPKDRYIAIETPRGTCNMVAWAYQLHGLPVLVRLWEDGKAREVLFPPNQPKGSECVFVDVSTHYPDDNPMSEPVSREPSITLFSTSNKEQLFSLKADPDEDVIDATFKAPARGIACRFLEKAIPKRTGRDRVLKEMAAITCSFSLCIATNLHVAPPGVQYEMNADEQLLDYSDLDGSDESEDIPDPLPYHVEKESIFEAARFLFGLSTKQLSTQLVEEYAFVEYVGKGFYDIEDAPQCIKTILNEWGPDGQWREASTMWPRLRLLAMHLSVMILAFAHVTNLDACADMPICELSSLVGRSDLSMAVSTWNGTGPITVKEDVWLQIIALMMVGQSGADPDLQTTALLSDRGWSVCVNTFGDADPSYIERGKISIKRGIPWRNGIWRHHVLDGPRIAREYEVWNRVGSAGDSVSLSCATKVTAGKPQIGERDDCLIVTLRFYSETVETPSSLRPVASQELSVPTFKIRRTGYNELWSALWMSVNTKQCPHPAALGQKVKLQPGWSALKGFGDQGSMEDFGNFRMCLTAGSAPARWRALISILEHRDMQTRVMVRAPDCCFTCAVAQTGKQEGQWYLIL